MPPKLQGAWPLAIAMQMMLSIPEEAEEQQAESFLKEQQAQAAWERAQTALTAQSEMAEAPSSASSTALKSKMAVEALKEQQAAAALDAALDAALEPLKEQQVMLKKQQAVARPRLSTPPRGPRNKKAKSAAKEIPLVSGARKPGVVTTESGVARLVLVPKKPGLVTKQNDVAPLVPKKIGLQSK